MELILLCVEQFNSEERGTPAIELVMHMVSPFYLFMY